MGGKKIIFFVSCFLFLVFLTGCEGNLSDGLKALDQSLGRTFGDFEGSKSSSTALDFFNKKSGAIATTTVAADLTAKQKEDIDAWLEKKGLNRYGDAKNAVYTGGTPLFNEKTGQPIERYDYILNKFPNILELIKKDK